MSDYLLTIKVPFSGLDTFAARVNANEILNKMNLTKDSADVEIKLQQINKGKAPEKINL